MGHIKPQAILKDWCRQGDRLIGEVWNHPGFTDGDIVRTSVILSPPDDIRNGMKVETKHTVYVLEVPSDVYKDKFKENK